MTSTDPTCDHAQLLLIREAALAERYAPRACDALDRGDQLAARRWTREYRLSTFRCRALRTILETRTTAGARAAHATHPGMAAQDAPRPHRRPPGRVRALRREHERTVTA